MFPIAEKEIVEACDFRKVRAVIPGGKERYLSVYEGLKSSCGHRLCSDP